MATPSKLLLAFCATLVGVFAVSARAPRQHAHAAATGFDYVINGGFEENVDGWTLLPANGIERDPADPSAGNPSAKILIPDAGHFTLKPSLVKGVAAGTYAFHASIRHSAAVEIDIDVCSTHLCPQRICSSCIVNGNDAWFDVSRSVQLDQTDHLTISIIGIGAAGDTVNIDDVRLTGPPPVTSTPTATITELPPPADTPPPLTTPTRTPTEQRTPKATATLPPVAAPASPELRNADFEAADDDGNPSDWYHYGGVLTSDQDRVYDGGRSARLESTTASTKWLYQVVTVEPGGGYEFSAWVRSSDAATNSAFLRVSWYASDDGSGKSLVAADSTERITAPDDAYHWLATTGIAAPDAAHSARLRIMLAPASAAAASIYADDAFWTPADVVAPSTLAPGADDASTSAVADALPADGTEATGDLAPTVRATTAQRVLGASRRPATTTAGNSAVAGSVAESGARVVINEVFYDPDGVGNNSAGEWVELYNAGAEDAILDGWSLADAKATTKLPTTTLGSHAYLVLAASDSFYARYPRFISTALTVGRIGNTLGNDGDRLSLRDAAGTAIDAISWGSDTAILDPAIPDAPTGHSIERAISGVDTDTADDFVDNEKPTPGAPIEAPSANPQRQNRTDEAVSSTIKAGQSFGWLPWTVAALAAVALIAAVSWRAFPTLAHRLRHQA